MWTVSSCGWREIGMNTLHGLSGFMVWREEEGDSARGAVAIYASESMPVCQYPGKDKTTCTVVPQYGLRFV